MRIVLMRMDSFYINLIPPGVLRKRVCDRRSNNQSRSSQLTLRQGVTLLELMVALGLLAMLLLVAWSLFDNLQKAEARSEGLANRVQVLRQIRSWLAEDLDQLVFPVNNPRIGKTSGSDVRFVGDSTGFVATLSPSLDPLPFLQDAFESSASNAGLRLEQEPEIQTEMASVYDTDQDRQVRAARRSPWAPERIDIEYALEPQTRLRENTAPTESEEVSYRLVRRERLPTAVSPSSSNDEKSVVGDGNIPSNAIPAADRQLTIRDLYRQTDETLDTRGPSLRERSLDGIQNAKFQYFDGTVWVSEWDSRKQNTFPAAIAVQFDFPSRSQARKEKAQRNVDESDYGQAEVSSDQSFGTIDTLLAQQPTAQAAVGDSREYLIATSSAEVTMVVATHFRSSKPTRDELDQRDRDSVRSTSNRSSRRSP